MLFSEETHLCTIGLLNSGILEEFSSFGLHSAPEVTISSFLKN
jgi:hypothetical protein